MKLRAMVMLALALLLGLASVWMARSWLQSQQQPPSSPVAAATTSRVVVAATALEFGSHFNRENLREIDWPISSVPPGAFSKIDDLMVASPDRIVLANIEANEPVLASKVTPLGGRATLSTVLPKDKRAITIRVNDVLGVAGFVLPGDRVDILLTRTPADDPHPNTINDVLLQNIRVLGVDQEASERKDKPTVAKAVTLEVSPDEAQMLTLGAQVGSLSLALRNHSDQTSVQSRTISLADLKGAPVKGGPVPVVNRVRRPSVAASGTPIQVIRGIEETTTQVRKE